LLVGVVVAVIWGGALLSSLVPHYGVSWQGHACGAVAGVIAAWLLSGDRLRRAGTSETAGAEGALARATAK
jgi:membrane associated rhomboid family serine protease